MAKLIQEKPELEKYFSYASFKLDERRGVVPDDYGKEILSIDDEIISNLTEEDARRLIEIHKVVKTKFIQSMIDIFVNPENHLMKTKEGEKVAIKSVFRK